MSKPIFSRRLLAAAMVATISAAMTPAAMAGGIAGAPAIKNLGRVAVDPYGNAPLTAVISLHNKKISDVKVTVHGKGDKGVMVSYPVGQTTVLAHDGVPIFGLYQKHANKVTVEFTMDGKRIKDEYTIQTAAIQNKYIDSRNVTDLDRVEVKAVAKGFEDRLYLVNSYTPTAQGGDLHWATAKAKSAGRLDANPAGGAMPFDAAPKIYAVDTQGEIRWWLNQTATYDGFERDVERRGWMSGFHLTKNGTWTFVQGQRWYEMDALGQILLNHRLPRGYVDLSHDSWEMPNGNVLLRAAKGEYVRPDGQIVTTVRDHIVEVNRSGQLVDVWNLNEILDPLRDNLLGALDMGAVCVNLDLDNSGKKTKLEPDTPFGDAVGVGPGRNWAHVNAVSYDAKDDSIVISARHQGVIKIGRDKQVKWIIAPRAGWNAKLAPKVLKPVDAKGKLLTCSDNGLCENTDFDFSYTQHTAWVSPKGTITVLDNGDGRHLDQPAMADMKYSRFVEYKVDEKAGTVQQIWEYGKERGYDWYSPITSNVEYRPDRDTMFGFGGSVGLFKAGQPTIGRINEIDYKTKAVKVEIDVHSEKRNSPHYRALIIEPNKMFGR